MFEISACARSQAVNVSKTGFLLYFQLAVSASHKS
ncbi:hypothetical protein FOCG_12595 [Fusarium oxysporum f. sp. radicis-lycopersici 26381]|uniref:Uncharacterized protein n=1 Tax=Fusarium oxysporum Fo47 TaxID=660027 RepID=W9JR59_FUSOX|nr:hypothetical protein FOZG_14492 [Fusarium oxysporum Fo47]EWZ85607.1 hypothetical protein FOWG_10714 [Fusarium oxysporum f. sp. lycopersici MN25]EXL45185.1 hypothetical protein FOCG_12595 [Fusarium oxysporum f. sp. radicis-lycopersici 26381]